MPQGDDFWEAHRLELLAERDAELADWPNWRADYGPGTHGRHEAMHLSSVLAGLVERELVQHPAVLLEPEWFAIAGRACDALNELYGATAADG